MFHVAVHLAEPFKRLAALFNAVVIKDKAFYGIRLTIAFAGGALNKLFREMQKNGFPIQKKVVYSPVNHVNMH